ncbi:M28 family metallopeptidase [Mycoplasmopsis opalescens]|uniref:M28 family metallopeptidase n=1 Tax=Mycoplasmopsis opalescens TaxID=114886 RepID=UPI0004A6FC0D|nr:M28 family peptidase [Mycoplasmopsis opalescens]
MKRSIKTLIAIGGALTSITLPIMAISCSNQNNPKTTDPKDTNPKITDPKDTNPKITDPKDTNPKITDPKITDEMALKNTFTNFLSTVHGRKAGDANNFKKESLETKPNPYKKSPIKVLNYGIKLEKDQRLTTEIVEKNLLYKFGEKVDQNVNNYGSYYAYKYLVKEIAGMGYTNHTPNGITYPEYDDKKRTVQYDETKDKEIVDSMKQNLNNDGFFTQGFLFANNGYNNVGNNIVVTINPSAKLTDNGKRKIKDFYIVSHYDSMNNVGPKGVSWGATDNATGVTVNLKLLKYFSDPKNRDNLSVRLHLIFVDGEEIGKLGSKAFVKQFLDGKQNELRDNSLGMINMDTVAGGDYMYIHSPNTTDALNDNNKVEKDKWNLSPLLRNHINTLSKERANKINDADQELKIHPQLVEGGYKEGETGDWSDHAPFYQIAKLPVAYVESTNFAIKSKYGVYDGYAQTINPKAWVLKDGKTTIEKLKERKLDNGQTVYDWPDGLKKDDFAILGDIWHSDLDTLKWVNDNIGQKIYKQLDTVFQTLKATVTSLHKIEGDNFSYIEL